MKRKIKNVKSFQNLPQYLLLSAWDNGGKNVVK